MPVVFVSHASRNDGLAVALERWLTTNGFTDLFIDHDAIVGGAKWREELRKSAGSCRVVICLVTPEWLVSVKCFAEFEAAALMGKRIIPLFLLTHEDQLDDTARENLRSIRSEDQGVDLRPCVDAGGTLDIARHEPTAERLRLGLRAAGANNRVGLDPEAFAIDRNVRDTPFPGLASFGDDDADAALFYGRSREIAETLEWIREMRAKGERRPLVILGASGAGKSSLLKAGIIPRLRRETPAWLPLRAFRPGADPLLNFAEALARTLADFGHADAHGLIRDRLLAAWRSAARNDTGELISDGAAAIEAALEAEGRALRRAANRDGATILVSIDQAEELARSEGESAEALADSLRAALNSTASLWQLAFTIRTDSFPELQRHRRFQHLEARGYDLRAIPVFRFDSVVEAPAKRYGVDVDVDLVDDLMTDAPKEDALPLLAFALQRLWHQYARSGRLTAENYRSVGRLKALMDDAAERALRGLEPEQDVPLPPGALGKRLDDLGASTFVPALVQINDKGATIRRVADWSTFTGEQRELLQRFERWRLIVRKGSDVGGGTVEVAHEALFREWQRLAKWLEPERKNLESLRTLQVDAETWDRAKRERGFLNHRAERLATARKLSTADRYRGQLKPIEREYLAACAVRERAEHRGSALMRGGIFTLLLGVIAALTGIIFKDEIEAFRFRLLEERGFIADNITPHVLKPEDERALKPGQSFKECGDGTHCPEMVVVPGGDFQMGSPDGSGGLQGDDAEAGRSADEGPRRKVSIKDFAVSKFEITWDDWETCVALRGCNGAGTQDQGWGKGRQPLINIDWFQAKAYAAWLARITGKSYRLLTEAEWEYAARGVTSADAQHLAYPWGDNDICDHANLADLDFRAAGGTGDIVECSDGSVVPAPTGKPYPANAFGLVNMHGNVWEWVEDCYVASTNDLPADGTAAPETAACPRLTRGGSWFNPPAALRSAIRFGITPGTRSDILGFRLARTISP